MSGGDSVDLRIRSRRVLADEVIELELVDAVGRELPEWEPGAHIEVEVPTIGARQYSLCGDPRDTSWRIAVLREGAGRGGSQWLHDFAQPGFFVRARGPVSSFSFRSASKVLLVAGGIGITPMSAMARQAARDGLDYRLVYSGSARSRMPYIDQLSSEHGTRMSLHISGEGTRLRVDELMTSTAEDVTIYACGPTSLLLELEASAGARSMHREHFSPVSERYRANDQSFELDLEATGTTITVEAGQSILDVAERAGAFVISSCKEGTCGACETRVLAGEVDHRDSILTSAERADSSIMFICTSRAARGSRLVLDL